MRLKGKKKDRLLEEVRSIREVVRQRVEAELSDEYRRAVSEGKCPWEGLWLSTKEIEELSGLLNRKGKVVLVEVTALLIFLALLSFGIYRLMFFAILPMPVL